MGGIRTYCNCRVNIIKPIRINVVVVVVVIAAVVECVCCASLESVQYNNITTLIVRAFY